MCSILAIIHKERGLLDEWRALMESMLALTRRRGPDDRHIEYIAPNVLLGSNRLSIVDLSENGRMPLPNLTRTRWIVFNGELYNYKELRSLLEQQGYVFRSTTDTEVVLHAYEEWGQTCVTRFNGMFAFVIWDDERQQLFVARDRFGIKPLYYYEDQVVVIISSDIRPFLMVPGIPREIDLSALSAFMHFRFVPGTRSIFQGIHKVGLGEMILWSLPDRHPLHTTFWEPTFQPTDLPEAALAPALYDKLRNAVRHTLVGDVPVGVLLSGGIDSSAIVALMDQLGHTGIRTFSATYGHQAGPPQKLDPAGPFSFVNAAEDESYYAQLVAATFHTQQHLFAINEEQVDTQFERMVFDLGEPLASTDALGHYLLAQQIARHVKVVLAGIGSDEILGGYVEMYFREGASLLDSAPDPLDYLRRFTNLDNQHVHMTDYLRRELVEDTYTQRLVTDVLGKFPRDRYPHERVNELAFFELFFGLSGWELDQADRVYMASSVEVRPVFLDNDFVDFALSILSTYKYRNGQEKYILKQALRGVVPDAIVNRRKFPGLGVPRAWYQKPWFQQRIERLQHTPLPFWDPVKLAQLFRRDAADRDFEILYRMVIFETWYELFMSPARWI